MEGSHTCAKYLAYICTFLNVQSRCASMQQWKAQCKVQCNPGRIIWSSPPPDTQPTSTTSTPSTPSTTSTPITANTSSMTSTPSITSTPSAVGQHYVVHFSSLVNTVWRNLIQCNFKANLMIKSPLYIRYRCSECNTKICVPQNHTEVSSTMLSQHRPLYHLKRIQQRPAACP